LKKLKRNFLKKFFFSALDPYTYKVYIGKVHSHIRSRSLALTLPNSGETNETRLLLFLKKNFKNFKKKKFFFQMEWI